MNQKLGIAESGIASAEIAVARQSRRKISTTMTASTAPSIIASIAE
jgi:antitoxin (DNA-binding transcriptional repressor) of toxin-antitoxin stability system